MHLNKVLVQFLQKLELDSFTKTLTTPKGNLEFSFIRVFTVKGAVYYVSVLYNLDSYLFTMVLRDGHWKIIDAPKVPGWIHGVEHSISLCIEENEATHG